MRHNHSCMFLRMNRLASMRHSSGSVAVQGRKNGAFGHAVGPKWTDAISLHHTGTGELVVERNCEFGGLVSVSRPHDSFCLSGCCTTCPAHPNLQQRSRAFALVIPGLQDCL